jgi:hypothetical protein
MSIILSILVHYVLKFTRVIIHLTYNCLECICFYHLIASDEFLVSVILTTDLRLIWFYKVYNHVSYYGNNVFKLISHTFEMVHDSMLACF